jgi:hypothetical protein
MWATRCLVLALLCWLAAAHDDLMVGLYEETLEDALELKAGQFRQIAFAASR